MQVKKVRKSKIESKSSRWNLLGAYFYFIVIMTLKRYVFPLNSIRSYFNGGLSFVVFSIVEGNVNIFCGIIKRYVLIISLFSIKNFLNKMSFL